MKQPKNDQINYCQQGYMQSRLWLIPYYPSIIVALLLGFKIIAFL